jgi:hypothetical protein
MSYSLQSGLLDRRERQAQGDTGACCMAINEVLKWLALPSKIA